MSAALLLPLDGGPVVIPHDDAALGEPQQPLHLVAGGAEAELALQHVRHDHVARRVHVVAVPGGDRVPGGEAQLLGQAVHLVIRHGPSLRQVALVGQQDRGDLGHGGCQIECTLNPPKHR